MCSNIVPSDLLDSLTKLDNAGCGGSSPILIQKCERNLKRFDMSLNVCSMLGLSIGIRLTCIPQWRIKAPEIWPQATRICSVRLAFLKLNARSVYGKSE